MKKSASKKKAAPPKPAKPKTTEIRLKKAKKK